jgi:uncharacterized protein YcnI
MPRPNRPRPSRLATFRAPARRTGAAVLLAVAAVVGAASTASAHVTVGADDARQGASDTLLTFRVPDEDATASTVKVLISFPKQTPVGQVKPAPKPGWTVQTTKTTYDPPVKTDDGEITQGVSQVVFTASSAAAAIPPGSFDTFQVLVGPLPQKVTSLAFPTVQTYSTGRSVAWIQPVTGAGDEPEAPAPVLQLLPAAAGAGSAGAADLGAEAAGEAGAAPATASADDVSSARGLALGGLVVGLLGLLAGGAGVALALRKSR